METDIINTFKKRHSFYSINNKIDISNDELKTLISRILDIYPSAFNSQETRIVLLLNQQHRTFWQLTKNKLISLSEDDKKTKIEQKISLFEAGYGTILFFIDTNITSNLSLNYPLYAPNFPIWAEQSNAMVQFMIWTSLSQKKIGASLQHYNPIIDDIIKKEFKIDANWKLVAQMPFGGIKKDVTPHDIKYTSERLTILA